MAAMLRCVGLVLTLCALVTAHGSHSSHDDGETDWAVGHSHK